MIYRFTLAAAVAAVTLTGCAKNQAGGPPPDFFSGPSQIDVSHLTTKADDGSSVFVTIDGNEGGMLTRGESKALHIPDGKHKVGGYVRTLFGYGRVTIDPITVVSKKGEVRHVAYSVTRNKPSFTDRGETPLPPAPEKQAAPAAAQQSTAATASQQSTTTAQPTATASQQSTTTAQPAATATQQSSSATTEKSTTSAAEAASTQQIIDAYGETSAQE
ncbi:hypothetical protein [Erwinia tasmaniensis]|uniref:hypothetical protein n=1 Tax=Erwinia tasmaniensis TaxID=338565 RepID=UPI003A4DB895